MGLVVVVVLALIVGACSSTTEVAETQTAPIPESGDNDDDRAFFTEDELAGDPGNWTTDPCSIKTEADLGTVTIDNWALPATRTLFLDDVIDCMSDAERTAFVAEWISLLTDGGTGSVERCMVPLLADPQIDRDVAQFFLVPELHEGVQAPARVVEIAQTCTAETDFGDFVINKIDSVVDVSPATIGCIDDAFVPAFTSWIYNDNGVRGRFGVTGDEANFAGATATQQCVTADEAASIASFRIQSTFPEADADTIACLGERLQTHPTAMYQATHDVPGPPAPDLDGYFFNAIDCFSAESALLKLTNATLEPDRSIETEPCLRAEINGRAALLASALVGDGAERNELRTVLGRCLTADEVSTILDPP